MQYLGKHEEHRDEKGTSYLLRKLTLRNGKEANSAVGMTEGICSEGCERSTDGEGEAEARCGRFCRRAGPIPSKTQPNQTVGRFQRNDS